MNFYTGDQAMTMFYNPDKDVPDKSIGVFQDWRSGEWIYWYSDGWSFDTGTATTEEEAFKKAKENFV